MATTRQPVNLTVSGPTAVRAGSYTPPYRIINTSLDATIWVADNPSVQPGNGTPINPGTSSYWTTDSDLYIILGNDTQSVSAGKSDVVLSYDVDDWQPNPIAIATAILNSGVLIIDNPVSLYDNSITGVGGVTIGPFDVSRYQSINYQIYTIGSSGTPRELAFMFYDDIAGAIGSLKDAGKLASYNYVLGRAVDSQYAATVPCKGKYLYITSDTGAGPTQGIYLKVVASYRAVQAFEQNILSEDGSAVYRSNFLLDEVVSVPAGASTTIGSYPPYIGQVALQTRVDFTSARADSYFTIDDDAFEDVISTNCYIQTLTNRFSDRNSFEMNGSTGRVLFNNRSATAATVRVNLSPVRT